MKVNIGPYPKNHKTERRVNIRIDRYDVWNMDDTLAMIILPMLRQLKKDKHGAPNTDETDVPAKLRSASKEKHAYQTDGTTDKKFFKRWDWILNEMIWAFEQLNDEQDGEDKFSSGKHDVRWVPIGEDGKPIGPPRKLGDPKTEADKKAKWFRMEKGPKDTYKIDEHGLKLHRMRIDNGLRLFGKYYRSLWD